MPSESQIDIHGTPLEEALELLAHKRGKQFAFKIRQIVFENLSKGRIDKRVNEALSHQAYVCLVAEKYTELHQRIHQLQVEKTGERLGGPLPKSQTMGI